VLFREPKCIAEARVLQKRRQVRSFDLVTICTRASRQAVFVGNKLAKMYEMCTSLSSFVFYLADLNVG